MTTVQFPVGKGIFLTATIFRLILKSHEPIQTVLEALMAGEKWPEDEADHSTPSGITV
jgi:hypothetical protein